MKITDFFLQRKKLTYLLMIFIIIAGIFSMISLPRQDSPNVNFNILTIRTFYPGSSPLDVEINITDLIEDELEQVDGIDEMSSFSIEGMSVIFIKIDPDFSDAERVKTDIRSAVDRVSNLPKEVKNRPIVEEMKSTDFPVLEVAIIGKNVGEDMLRKIARDMEYEIKSVSKVGTINKIGYRKKEVKILCDNREMSKRYVSFVEILRAIGARNVKLTGGTLESFADEKNIVTFSEFEDVLSVKDVIIRSNFSGEHIKVSDIAEVKLGHEKRKIISRTNGFNSINLLVKRRGTTDVIDLSKEIDKVIEKYQKTYKEKGVDIVKVVDFTYYTKSLLNIVTNNALLGFCLVLVSLFVFLNFYTAIWVAVGIPLSILAAYMFFPLFDITTNQITLITIIIVLGMLVDDAIVIAENINRHQEAGVDGYNAALIGTREVFKPVLATILTTIFCFVPMYFMKGIVGKFVFAIPTVVILILVMSFFESITLLPVHLSGRNGALSSKKEKWLNAVRTNYGRLLKFFLRHRKTTFAGFFLWAAIAGGIFGYYGKIELFPTSDFDLFYIVMELPTGTSLHETSGKVGDVEKIVATIPDKLMMGYKTVIGEHRTDEAAANPALHENWALITIYLHPAAKRDVRSEAIIEDLKEKTVALNGFTKLD
ncbi:MAG: efflux RND transporter permease subunit, partial [Bacteriovoracaceae bacterium]|nr:efflux RND transporter permease subunit [Bacteriovoracaceae bacterium]